jgi:hypothetical protein
MNDRLNVLTGELQILQKNLNTTTNREAHAALLREVRSKLEELDELVKHRLDTVHALRATPTPEKLGEERDSSFDIFERLPGGGVIWRGVVSGEDNAAAKLSELGQTTANELFACHLRTRMTIGRASVASEERLDGSAPSEREPS